MKFRINVKYSSPKRITGWFEYRNILRVGMDRNVWAVQAASISHSGTRYVAWRALTRRFLVL
jgi:hypothetical protein